MKGRAGQLIVSLLVGGVCLYFAFRNAPIDATWADIADVPAVYHVGYVALVLLQFVLRSKRWAIQAEGISGQRIPLREAVGINAVAFAAVFLLPFRLGEFVRPYLVSQRKIMTASEGLANSVVERIVDGLLTTAFFGVVLVLLKDQNFPSYVSTAGWLGLLVFGGASIFFAIAYLRRGLSLRLLRLMTRPIHPKLEQLVVRIVEGFLDGLDCFKGAGAVLGYVGLSAAYWILNGFAVWLMLRGLGVEHDVLAGYFAVSFMVIAVMIPAPPGNIGNFHFFTKQALVLLGIAETTALAAAVILHGWQVIALLVWSGAFIAIGDISLARVRDATRQPDGNEEPSPVDAT